jgi:hypothetical protein
MTVEELERVALLMQKMGLTHVKLDGLEISRPEEAKAAPGPADNAPIEDKAAEEFTSLLKLSNEEILDRMFPEPRLPGGPDDSAPVT